MHTHDFMPTLGRKSLQRKEPSSLLDYRSPRFLMNTTLDLTEMAALSHACLLLTL